MIVIKNRYTTHFFCWECLVRVADYFFRIRHFLDV